jgi:peptidyl-prolyl cis-trans isomerase C
LITRALILEEALIREAVVDERAVDGYMSQTLQNQFNNDRTQLLSALSRERMTIADYRKRLTDDLLVMMLRRQEVDDRTVVSPGAVRAAYDSRLDSYRQPEQVKLHVILLQRGESPEEQAAKRAQADLVVKRLASGDDFTAMAREVSEGPGASGGGEWEWTKTSEILPALRDRLAELEAGTCSGVIETGEWFFIARLDARRPETMIPFEDVRQNLERELKRAEEERIFRRWIAALEARHCVRRMTEPWMDSQ